MNDDLKELLGLLNSHQVDYLVIGAHALAFYNQPRFTEDLDLWVGRSKDNAVRMQKALHAFGASIGDVGAQRFSQFRRHRKL